MKKFSFSSVHSDKSVRDGEGTPEEPVAQREAFVKILSEFIRCASSSCVYNIMCYHDVVLFRSHNQC